MFRVLLSSLPSVRDYMYLDRLAGGMGWLSSTIQRVIQMSGWVVWGSLPMLRPEEQEGGRNMGKVWRTKVGFEVLIQWDV